MNYSLCFPFLTQDVATYERIHRTVDSALRSSFVPTVTAALHGLSYLLQGALLIQCGRETNVRYYL